MFKIGNCTDLHAAVESDNVEAIEVSLQYCANVDAKDINGCTALHRAAQYNFRALEILLKHGANIDVQDNFGNTALHRAVECANVEAIEILLKHGASVDVQNRDSYTALRIAADRHIEVISLLLQSKANVDVQDKYGNTALHIAAQYNFKALEILFQYGANVDVQNKFGSTALHKAVGTAFHRVVEYDKIEAMEILLKHKASVDIQDGYGNTALHYAVNDRNVKETSILLEYGADVTLKDCHEENPFSLLEDSQLYDTEFIDKLIAIHTERIFCLKPEDYDFDQLHFGGNESQDYINHGVVARYNSLRILEELKQVDAICIKQKAEIALNDIPANVRQDLVASYERHNEMFIEKLIYDPIIKKFSQHKLLEIKLLPFIVELSGITRGAINDIDIRKCLVGIQNPQEVFDQDLIGEDMQDAF